MDTIRFEIIKNKNGQNSEALIYVNDKNLIDLLKEYEQSFAVKEGHPELAGDYMGRWPLELYNELVQVSDDKKPILACGSCGEWGCWSIDISVIKEGDHIIWKDFEQPFRNEWDYSFFPIFKFDAEQYQTELNRLGNLASSQA